MSTRNSDEWTIERWRVEPRWSALEFGESTPVDEAPPLWKDLALAAAVAVALWSVAALVVG